MVTAKSDDPALKEESRSLNATPGDQFLRDFVFGAPTTTRTSVDCRPKAEQLLDDGDAAAAIAVCQEVLRNDPGNVIAAHEIKEIRDTCNAGGGHCPGVN